MEVRVGTDTSTGDVWAEAYVLFSRSDGVTYRRRIPYIATQGSDYPEILEATKAYVRNTLERILHDAKYPGY